MRVVRIKVKGHDGWKPMAEAAAKRLVQVDPENYQIAEDPRTEKINVVSLPPIPEKKSVAPAGVEVNPNESAFVKKEETPIEPARRGRPKSNQ